MTYDPTVAVPTEQLAPPLPAAVPPAVPPVTNFVLGAPARGGRGAGRLVAAVAAVAVVAGGGWFAWSSLGGGSDEPAAPQPVAVAPQPKPKAKAKATTSYDVLASTLRNAATAEESYFIDAGTYTTSVAKLKAEGLSYRGVTVTVVHADKRRYCIKAAGAPTVVGYFDSRTGLTRSACR